jgi:23S rRNA (guanine2445-N2)-methyltransferase / 23S rRNA (guanine2069-N7)-methyltransferase
MAKGKRFLNLFGYTGTATVHAAKGGARNTTTVDLSANYLHWAKMNLVLNGLSEVTNTLIMADSLSWLRACKEKFDLIFIDPPTFSNTKKENRVFDIQKDHLDLITLAMQCLDKNGLLLFSTNFRKFLLDPEIIQRFSCHDISKISVDMDFARDQKIHRCWEIRHIN